MIVMLFPKAIKICVCVYISAIVFYFSYEKINML